jgi:hypothetical protein
MSTYFEYCGITIQKKFEEFDTKNPLVWSLFKQQVFKAISKGKKKLSAKTILGFIRWNLTLTTTGDEFKINDIFTSRYARKYIEQFPQHKEVFNLRNLRS